MSNSISRMLIINKITTATVTLLLLVCLVRHSAGLSDDPAMALLDEKGLEAPSQGQSGNDAGPAGGETGRSLIGTVDDIRYYIYPKPSQPDRKEEIDMANKTALKNYPKPAHVKILIHGFLQNSDSEFPQNSKNAYLEKFVKSREKTSVIVMDYGGITVPPGGPLGTVVQYIMIAGMVTKMGMHLAEFIRFLMTSGYITSPDAIHLIGFSLGGQIAGLAGHQIVRTRKQLIGRITGLDPAGPGFDFVQTMTERLEPSSAQFVDAIHTNSGQLGNTGVLGHADFYPNGGINQPSCTDRGLGGFLASLTDALTGSCSHAKSHEYFTRSINANNIVGCKCFSFIDFLLECHSRCPNRVVFGENCPVSARGMFYLTI